MENRNSILIFPLLFFTHFSKYTFNPAKSDIIVIFKYILKKGFFFPSLKS